MVVVTYWGVVTVPKVCSFQDVSCLLKNHVEQSFPFFVFVRWLSTQKMYEWVVVEYWSVVTVHKVFSFHDLSCLLKKSYGAIILFSFKFNIFMFCVPALFTASM